MGITINGFNEIKEILNRKIVVKGEQFNFTDMIDNETISDFPIYSHRIRSEFVKGVLATENFLKGIKLDSVNNIRTIQETANQSELTRNKNVEAKIRDILNAKTTLEEDIRRAKSDMQSSVSADSTRLQQEIVIIKDTFNDEVVEPVKRVLANNVTSVSTHEEANKIRLHITMANNTNTDVNIHLSTFDEMIVSLMAGGN